MTKTYKITNFELHNDGEGIELLVISKIDQEMAKSEPFPHLADNLTEYFVYRADSINHQAMDNIVKKQNGIIEVDLNDFIYGTVGGTEDDPTYGYFHKSYVQSKSDEYADSSNQKTSEMDFDYFRDEMHDGHLRVVSFFKEHPLGTNNPIMTFLSILSPLDRCVILEQLHESTRLNSILNDKLLLAYVTSGRVDLGRKVVQFATEIGESDMNIYGLQDKLDLPQAPVRKGEERIEIYTDFLSKSQNPVETEFLNLMIEFCRLYY